MNNFRPILAITFAIAAVMCVPTTKCAATIWYVSTTGSDSNSGSAAKPFLTLYKAVGVVKPGDTVDVDGGTYSLANTPGPNQGYPVDITRSGASWNPITIQSTPGQSAVIDATNVWEPPYDGIDVNANYVNIQNLTVENGGGADLMIDDGSFDTVRNCTFTGGVWTGVSIGGPGDMSEMQHDAILGCSVYNNCLVNKNGAGPNWGSGIIMANCEYSDVEDNTVHNNWGEGIGCYSFGGQPSSNNFVFNNTIYDNWSVELYIADAQYIDAYGNFIYADSNAELRGGYPAIGIAADNENASYLNIGCNILNNVVIGGMYNFRYAGPETYSGFYAGGLNGFSIYNNVFYNGSLGCVQIDYDANNSFGFCNNISWQTNNSVMVAYNGGGNNGGVWNNCWDGNGANNMYSPGGTDVPLANIDPGFVKGGSLTPSDWALTTSSPCYSAGWNCDWLFNFDFNSSTRPYSAAWTMGAFAAAQTASGNGGKLLPAGYLHTKGNQILDSAGVPVRLTSTGWSGTDSLDNAPIGLWSVNYKETMNGIVEDGFNCIRVSWTDAGLHSSDVCGNIDYTTNPTMVNMTQIQVIDAIIAYAGKIGLKVILDHHSDEGLGPDESQQANGLWYDVGPNTDGTDGAGNKGTVTAADFQADWVAVAKRYAGNSTVIGFDLDNEPHVGYGSPYNGLNWGAGGPGDIWAMFTSVGNAIGNADPGALIICEGPLDVTDQSSIIWWMMDLTNVVTKPVVLKIPRKVVYSVHEYPTEVSGLPNDSGAPYIARMNEDWGYLVSQNIAPVWIGEMGAPVTTTDTDGNAWIATLLPYVNGLDAAQGGPTFSATSEPISTDWWFWGTYNDGDGWGTLSTWDPTVYVPRQQAVSDQLLWLTKPRVFGLSKSAGIVGSNLTITGSNFYAVESVTFGGGASSTFTVVSPSTIKAIVPSGALNGPIKVTTPGGAASSATVFTLK